MLFAEESSNDFGWNKLTDISSKASDLFDQPRAEERIGIFWHQKYCFHILIELSIHQSELKLKFEITHSSQSTQDRASPVVDHIINK